MGTGTSNSDSGIEDKSIYFSLDEEENNVYENELLETEEATESVELQRFIETENNELLITIDLPFTNEELSTFDEEDPLALQDDQVLDIKKKMKEEQMKRQKEQCFHKRTLPKMRHFYLDLDSSCLWSLL